MTEDIKAIIEQEADRYVKTERTTVDAIQWDGSYQSMMNIQRIFPSITLSSTCNPSINTVTSWCIKAGLNNRAYVSAEEYIIKHNTGIFETMRADVFLSIYSPFEQPPTANVQGSDAVELGDWKERLEVEVLQEIGDYGLTGGECMQIERWVEGNIVNKLKQKQQK